MREKQRTGAATLETHMDANNAMLIIVNKTTGGRVPALARIHVDMTLAMLYFVNEAANVKPPRRSKITEFHIVERINLEDSTESIGVPSTFLRTPSITIIIGIKREVTKSGIVSVAHNKEAHTSNAKQFF